VLLVETQFVFKFIYLHTVPINTQINTKVISYLLQTAIFCCSRSIKIRDQYCKLQLNNKVQSFPFLFEHNNIKT